MAALTALICSALQDLYDLTDAWLWTGLSISSSFRYLRVKRRLELFQLYCREVWLRESLRNALAANSTGSSSNNALIHATSSASVTSSNNNCIKSASGSRISPFITTFNEMQRDFIDFAAVEASQEAISSSYTGTRLMRSNSWDKQYGHIDGLLNMDDVEVISGLEIDTSFYEYYDANPVYVDANLNQLTNGSSFTITGEIPLYCERFSINFIIANESKDIALHINPRLPQNYIVRNTKVRDVWGYEEVSSPLPFTLQRGTPFSMQVLVTSTCFMISVNGHHFAEYNHRLPFNNIRILEIKGDVSDIMVKQNIVTEYPQRSNESLTKNVRIAVSSKEPAPTASPHTSPVTSRKSKENNKRAVTPTDEVDGSRIPKAWRMIALNNNNNKLESGDVSAQELSLPYYGLLPKRSLREGRCLRVEGRVRLLPQSFYINLQQGQNIWPHPIIALHFNPRFSKQGGAIDKAIVCRNAWHNGSWDTEERSELVTDFRPGKVFSLAIVCTGDSFEILLNRKPITKFKYRMKPDIVDTVYIQGDIKLWDVSLESV